VESIRLFTGFDQREAVGWHVFTQSVIERTDRPVEIIALTEKIGKRYGVGTDGTNAFTKLRFLVPYLCGFQGWAIFADAADMLLMADLAELWSFRQKQWGNAVCVVKHDYQPASTRKYIGTDLEAENQSYPRKNWSSLILWDCSHLGNQHLKPEYIEKQPGSFLHRFSWLPDNRIGELPIEWNWLDEYGEASSKIQHYTNGIPGFSHYTDAPHADEWRRTAVGCLEGLQYQITVGSER